MSRIDLHIHSTASDGLVTPSEIVYRACALGLTHIALCDHDSVSGVQEALDAAEGTPLSVIPAVELSAGTRDEGVHILGYHIDHTAPALLERLSSLRDVRADRAAALLALLGEGGIHVSMDEVHEQAHGGAVGRAHVAHVLVRRGHAATVREAFDSMLGEGRPFYVPKPVHPPADVIAWVLQAGGVPVLAHPALSRADDLVPSLVEAGLAGIEAFHADHDADTAARYRDMALAYGLVATGGSDFHGEGAGGHPLGTAAVPSGVLAELAARVGRATEETTS